MSKELPYYKFYPAEWIKGDITLCSMETQGVFINLCSYYWLKDCNICLSNAKQRFSKHETSVNELINREIILLDEDENIIINFLDEQMRIFNEISVKRSEAGSSKRKKSVNKCLTNDKQMISKCTYIREDKIREDNIVIPPKIEDVKNYCKERKNNVDANKWFDFYTSKGWMVGKNKMKDWKAAVRTWEDKKNNAPQLKKL